MANMMACSAHGKQRTAQNLTDDGMGGFKCVPGSECQTGQTMGGQGGGGGYGSWNQGQQGQQGGYGGGGGGDDGGKSGGKGQSFTAGDWNCPACGDHQFARNIVCRKCGAPNPGGPPAQQSQGSKGGYPGGGGKGTFSAAEMEIQKLERDMAMLQQQITGGGGEGMQQMMNPGQHLMQGQGLTTNQMMGGGAQMMSGKVMKKVRICSYFEKGMCTKGGQCTFAHGEHEVGQPQIPGMIEIPNPKTGTTVDCSAHGRARTLNNMMEDGAGSYRCAPGFECQVGTPAQANKGMKPGDWNCPGCGDHQFARNTECRKCGAPNPNPGAWTGPGSGIGAAADLMVGGVMRSSPY